MQRQEVVEEQARKRLQALLPAGTADWCTPEYVVRFEFPSDGILKIAEQREADLIVMGVHKSNATSLRFGWPLCPKTVFLWAAAGLTSNRVLMMHSCINQLTFAACAKYPLDSAMVLGKPAGAGELEDHATTVRGTFDRRPRLPRGEVRRPLLRTR